MPPQYTYNSPVFNTWEYNDSDNESTSVEIILELSDKESLADSSDPAEEALSSDVDSVQLSDYPQSEGSSNAWRPDSESDSSSHGSPIARQHFVFSKGPQTAGQHYSLRSSRRKVASREASPNSSPLEELLPEDNVDPDKTLTSS